MMNKRRLTRLLALSAVLFASGLPVSGCCESATFEISADLSIPFPGEELERRFSVSALGDRVRLEFSEPVLAKSGYSLQPCSSSPSSGDPPGDDGPFPDEDPATGGSASGEGGAGGASSPGGAAGASMMPEPLGGAGGLGGEGGMTAAEPPTTPRPDVDPEEEENGYHSCYEIIGYNISRVISVTRRGDRAFSSSVSVRGTAIDEVKGCGWREPQEKGIVLKVVE